MVGSGPFSLGSGSRKIIRIRTDWLTNVLKTQTRRPKLSYLFLYFSAASPLGSYPGYPPAPGSAAAVPFGGLGSPALLTPPPHLAGGRPGPPPPLSSSSQERDRREREDRDRKEREERERRDREERERRDREERDRRERELQRSRDLEIRLSRDSAGSIVKVI